MAKNSMDLYHDASVAWRVMWTFCGKPLQVLVEGIIACPMPDTGDAEVSAQIGAQHGERNPECVTHRNGYRSRDWDTPGGDDGTAHPQDSRGQLLPQPAWSPGDAARRRCWR